MTVWMDDIGYYIQFAIDLESGWFLVKGQAMWQGIIPTVLTKFTEGDALDHAEMKHCNG